MSKNDGFPDSLAGKESTCNMRDLGSIPGLGRAPGEGKGYPLQYSWASLVTQLIKNQPTMRETWVGKIHWRRERLPTPVFLGFPCGSAGKESACNEGDLGWEDPLEKGMATHSSILAWRIPWIVKSMGSQRVRHD